MQHEIKNEKPGKIRSLSRRGGCALATISLLIAAGCSSPEHVGDPLRGEIHPQQLPNHAYGPTPPSSNPGQHASMPDMPSAEASVSMMSLASMSGSRPLSIGGSQASSSASSPAPRVQEVQPDSPSAYNSFSATKQTHDILQAQLRARGVVWQKQEAVPEGVEFTCIVPNRNSAENNKIYVSTARDYISAVQAILLQIDQN